MNIFINYDDYKQIAIKTRNNLINACDKLHINVCDKIDDADFICSIGGDGTFLQSSRLSNQKPLIGINCGTLGYLTDINPADIEKALKDVSDNNYYIENRMMLEGKIIKYNDEIIDIPHALNDISISKNTFGVVRFDVIIDGQLINSYTADGIIICTPTGSTAYNLSCGGPIVDPTAQIITITPIAPHSILNRSIVLSDNSIIEIKITELRGNTTSYVLYDGKPIELTTKDRVKIYKSKQITKIVKFNHQSFVENIRKSIH